MKILAVVTEAETLRPCLDAAVLAARVDPSFRVEALHVVVDPEHLLVATEEIQIQRLREEQEGTAGEKAAAVQSAFVAWNAGSDENTPHVGWKALVGSEDALVVREAEGAGLLVLTHASSLDDSDARYAALRETGKPLLFVPERWRPRGKRFAHVAVGLCDSEATNHAISAALPWLLAADKVTALWIGNEADAHPMLDSLERSEVKVDLRVFSADGEDRGAQIVREAKKVGADLLVAGAYRHGRLLEWLMGSTTSEMLAAAEVPLLLAH